MKLFPYLLILLMFTACSSGKEMSQKAKTAQRYIDNHSVQLLKSFCSDWDSNQHKRDYKKYCVESLRNEEEMLEEQLRAGGVAYERIFALSEKVLFKATVKVPYSNFAGNVDRYYSLMKINPEKALYFDKFRKYSQLMYKNRVSLKDKMVLQIDNSGESASIVKFPGYNGDRSKITVPDGTFLYFTDYAVTKGVFGEIIYFVVEYKGATGYLAEFETDRNMNAVFAQ